MKKKTVKKVVKKKTKKKAKKLLTHADIVKEAIASIKNSYSKDELKQMIADDESYGLLESEIDGLLYEEKYKHFGYKGEGGWDESILLERLVFNGIQILQKGQRHTCDPYYDDAFNGYDGF